MSVALAAAAPPRYTVSMKLGLICGLAALCCLACDFSSDDPMAPPGSIRGEVAYRGAPFACDGDAIVGQLILRLHDVDRDTTQVRELDGSRLFDASGCGAPDGMTITQTAAFTFSGVSVGRTYRLEAFWDGDADFVDRDPLLNEPTRGDVLGGVFEDPAATPRVLDELSVDAGTTSLRDVVITLDEQVHTERPLFRWTSSTTALDSSALVSTDPDVTVRDNEMFALTNAGLELMPVGDEPYRSALDSAGVSVGDGFVPRAFWSAPFDADGDGVAERHPVLGDGLLEDFARTWRTPAVELRRTRTSQEVSAGVPDVYLYPAARPTETTVREVFAPTVPLTVPPVAIMVLDPDVPVCRIPIYAPGNAASLYEGAPKDCQELPTGRYEVTVRQGIAGGTLSTMVPATISDTGFRITGGRWSGQSWSIPNDLQDLVIDQGPGGRFLVLDRNPDDDPDAMSTEDGHGVESCAMAPDDMGMLRAVTYMPVAPACCAPVEGLCGKPLCDPITVEDGTVREADSSDCVPFLIPPSCCR